MLFIFCLNLEKKQPIHKKNARNILKWSFNKGLACLNVVRGCEK